jgi:hypothetical protein
VTYVRGNGMKTRPLIGITALRTVSRLTSHRGLAHIIATYEGVAATAAALACKQMTRP